MAGRALLSISKRIAGFAVPVAASTVLGVVAIPLLVSSLGAPTWGTLAVVQATAQVVGIVVAFGWGATGPSIVAMAQPQSRPQLYLDSIVARSFLFVICMLGGSAILVMLTRGDLAVSVAGLFAYLLPYLGASWYFVGEGRPWRLLVCDSLPTLLGTVGGLLVVVASHDLIHFLVLQASGSLCAAVVDAVVILRGTRLPLRLRLRPRAVAASLMGQRHAVASVLTSGLYVNLPLLAVQVFVPSYVPTYALADRLFRYASIAFAPVQQFLQSWVPGGTRDGIGRRMTSAAMAGAAFGVLGGCAVAFLAKPLLWILSAGSVDAPLSLSLPLGIAFVFVGTSAAVGYACLVPLGRERSLAVSTLLGAVVGAPLILLLAACALPVGVAWAVAVSEAAVTTYQCAVLMTEVKRMQLQPAAR